MTQGVLTGIRNAAILLLLVGLACGVVADGRSVFSVVDYGARGDGRTDDTNAFVGAWAAACRAGGWSATMVVPAWMTFLVGPTRFDGPCASKRIIVQVMGTITAPPPSAWRVEDYWLMFYQVNGFTVTGNGVLDGRGRNWWVRRCRGVGGCLKFAPTALKLMKCNNLELSHLTSKDSTQMHILVGMSRTVKLTQLTITAPGRSPNTDGIHIGDSSDVHITRSTIGTGDDCISIGCGSTYVTVDSITCGPGHGVRVGSLGKQGQSASVEFIEVKNVQFINTENGARIKTWQGGQGYAKSISFTNINFTNVDHPVLINQFYRSRDFGPQGVVMISNVTYNNLRGTSRRPTVVEFDCSGSNSCRDIHVNSMAITRVDRKEPVARCLNARGYTSGFVYPKIPCLNLRM